MTPRTCGRQGSPAASTAPPAAMTRGAPTAGRRSSRSSHARGCTARRSPTSAGRVMPSIDIHAHLMPQCLWRTVATGRDWYGTRYEPGDGLGFTVTQGKRSRIATPKVRFTPEERLADMDAQGVDVQVVSIHMPLVSYHLEPAEGRRLARDVNDEIAAMTRQWPRRFAGLATLPAQDVGAAIDELERAVHVLGLKGAELDRKSTRLNSSHSQISYAVFCLKKKNRRKAFRCSTQLPKRFTRPAPMRLCSSYRCPPQPTLSWKLLMFFFNDTATTEIYTLSLHDALPTSAHS